MKIGNQTSEFIAPMTNMSTERVEKQYDLIESRNVQLCRNFVLTNKMKVFLISDPTTDKSAAAINIKAGNYIILLYISSDFYKNIYIKSF